MGRSGARITSRPRNLEGGGTNSGRPAIGPESAAPRTPSREEVLRGRVETTGETVGDALTQRVLNLSDSDAKGFTDNAMRAVEEASKGDRRALDTYSLAIQKVMVQDPKRWKSLVDASGMAPSDFISTFAPAAGTPAPVKAISDSEGVNLALGGDLPYGPGGTVDAASVIGDRLGGELSAQPMPVSPNAPLTRAANNYKWKDFLGGWKNAHNVGFSNRAASDSRQLYPQLASHEMIRLLREFSGQPFVPAVGDSPVPKPPQNVQDAMAFLEQSAKPVSGPGGTTRPGPLQFNFEQKSEMRDQITQEVAAEVMADESIPEADKQLAIQQIVTDRLDNFPVSTYPPEIADTVRQLLAQQNDIGISADELAAPVPVYGEMGAMTGPTMVSPIAAASSGGPEVPFGGRIRIPGTSEKYDIVGERNFNNIGRSPLDKALEENSAILAGRGATPSFLQRLMSRGNGVDPDVQNLIQQNVGGIYDLDERIRNWRRGITIDGQTYPFPADVLAELYANQLGITDPAEIARMIAPMQASIDIYTQGMIKPRGSAAKLYDSLIQPGSPEWPEATAPGRNAEKKSAYLINLLRSIQEDTARRAGGPKPILFKKPVAPPPPAPDMPSTPDMTDTGMMPQTNRFARNRMNPLAALVG